MLCCALILPGFSQVSVNHLAEFDNLNFTEVVLGPDGTAYSFAFGITDGCESINTVTCTSYGDDWSAVSSCESVDWPDAYLTPIDAHFFDSDNGLVVMSQKFGGYNTPGIYKTADGGETWEAKFNLTVDSGADGINGMAFKDENNGVALSFYINDADVYESNVILSSDGGETWTEVTEDMFTDTQFMEVVAIGDVFYIMAQEVIDWDGVSWMVYKSTDNGASWTEVYAEETVLYDGETGIQFISEEIGFVGVQDYATSRSSLRKTTDGGETWTEITVPEAVLPELMEFNDIHFINENEGFIVAGNHCDDFACYRGYAVLYTDDGGSTWEVLVKDPYASYALYSIAFDNEAMVGYVVGGDIDTYEGNIFKVAYANAGIADSEAAFNLSPNPTNDLVTVQSKSEVEQITVLDLQGRMVAELYNQTSISFTALGVDKGIYTVLIKDANNNTTIQRLVYN